MSRIVRPADLVDVDIEAEGARIRRPQSGPPLLVGGSEPGLLTVTFSFQHLGEQAYVESLVSPEPSGIAGHRAARPTRLVFELPPRTTTEWSVRGVLSLLPTLALKVVPLATPAPADDDEEPTEGPVLPPWLVLDDPLVPLGDLVLGGELTDRRPRRSTATTLPSGRVVSRALLDAQGARLVYALRRSVDHWPFAAESLHWPNPRGKPRAPRDDETAIEIPYRLVVSPSGQFGAFDHDDEPLLSGDGLRAQLWHTRLTTRVTDDRERFVGHTDDPAQRIVRAVWTPDLAPPDASGSTDVYLMSTTPGERRGVVRQSAATDERVTPVPLRVKRLHLSTVGASIDWRGVWNTDLWKARPGTPRLRSYRHVADMGRDSYVRIEKPVFLFPPGLRADWVTVTERKVHEPTRTAYLRKRFFIVLRKNVISETERDLPFGQVVVTPITSPDLDPPPDEDLSVPFVPTRGGQPFTWDLSCVDRAGDIPGLCSPFLVVSDDALDLMLDTATESEVEDQLSAQWAPFATMDGRGQNISFAASFAHGDTRLETKNLSWDGELDAANRTSRPYMTQATTVVPSLRHLAPQAPAVSLEWADAYLDTDTDLGFGAGNPSGLFLRLADPPVPIDFSGGTDRAGGFVQPNLMARALSRELGVVGDDGSTPGGLQDGAFDPTTFLQGALPKLFGLFDLVELIEAATGGGLGLDKAPAFITEALDVISSIATEAQRLVAASEAASARLADDIANAAHAGAAQEIQKARTVLDAAIGDVLGDVDDLADELGLLAGDPGRIADIENLIASLITDLPTLRAAILHPRVPAAVRAAVDKPLAALQSLLSAADVLAAVADFAENIPTLSKGMVARYEWQPPIKSPSPVLTVDKDGFGLAAEVRAGGDSAPQVDVSAELRNFGLQLLPGEPLMAMKFSRIGFHVGSNTKPEVDVVFDGIEFLGALGFIDRLRSLIPFDGFADPPYVDVSTDGVTAGFDLELPNIAVGVFSLENIALGADARVPFLGDAVTVGFYFCKKEAPFRVTVMCVGGGGWVSIRLSPKGLVELEMGIEAAASLSIDLGVASGSVAITVGVYLKIEADKGSLTGYFRIRGEVDVLGLVSASITLELSLTYHFQSGKLIGKASLVIEIEILFFSMSVSVTCERKLAGSQGDPVLLQLMPPNSSGRNVDWSAYCAAFSPMGAA